MSSPSARTTTSTSASAPSRAARIRVLAYRKLFEDGPGTITAWMERVAASRAAAGAS